MMSSTWLYYSYSSAQVEHNMSEVVYASSTVLVGAYSPYYHDISSWSVHRLLISRLSSRKMSWCSPVSDGWVWFRVIDKAPYTEVPRLVTLCRHSLCRHQQTRNQKMLWMIKMLLWTWSC